MLPCTNPPTPCLPLSLSSTSCLHYHNKASCSIITSSLFRRQWRPCRRPIVLSKHNNEWQKLSADLIMWPTKFPWPSSLHCSRALFTRHTHSRPVGLAPPLPSPPRSSLFRLTQGHPFVQRVCVGVCWSSIHGCSLLMRAFRGGALVAAAAIQQRISNFLWGTSAANGVWAIQTDTKKMRLWSGPAGAQGVGSDRQTGHVVWLLIGLSEPSPISCAFCHYSRLLLTFSEVKFHISHSLLSELTALY